MEISDEKFFEELAKEKSSVLRAPSLEKEEGSSAEADFGIELAKASTIAPAKTVRAPLPKIQDDEPEGQLAIDVYQTPSDIVVESAIAGIKPEDIDVTVTADSVSVKGERRRDREIKNDDYYYQECYWGRFSRSVILPQEVDPEKADVSFKNGILTVVMPKLQRKKSRKLKVKIE